MTALNPPKYTVVQHSGYGYSDKPGFEKGLEVRTISTVGELRIVQAADGLVFETYNEADDYCENNVGPGLYPNAPGAFSRRKIDGLRIYQPPNRVGVR